MPDYHPISILVFDGSKIEKGENPYEHSTEHYDLCPYDLDVNGKEVWCNCTDERRRACADDI